MRTFEHVTYHDGGDDTEYRFSARLVVHAGVPERGGLFPLSYGVDRGNPVVVIEQKSGDQRTSHGSVLQAIHPRDARALAKMLVDAANALDPEGCVDYPKAPEPKPDAYRSLVITKLAALGRRMPTNAEAMLIKNALDLLKVKL